MAGSVLFLGRRFAVGQRAAAGQEHRVVAEAPRAARELIAELRADEWGSAPLDWIRKQYGTDSAKSVERIDSVIVQIDAALAEQAPGHTDLMVPPESIDAFMEANPLPLPNLSPPSYLTHETFARMIAEGARIKTGDPAWQPWEVAMVLSAALGALGTEAEMVGRGWDALLERKAARISKSDMRAVILAALGGV